MTVTILCSPLTSKDEPDESVRVRRGLWDWTASSKKTTSPPTTTPLPPEPNHIEIGQCEKDDKVKFKIYYSLAVTTVNKN